MKKKKTKQPSGDQQIQIRLPRELLAKCPKIIKHKQFCGHSEITTRSALIRFLLTEYPLPQAFQ